MYDTPDARKQRKPEVEKEPPRVPGVGSPTFVREDDKTDEPTTAGAASYDRPVGKGLQTFQYGLRDMEKERARAKEEE